MVLQEVQTTKYQGKIFMNEKPKNHSIIHILVMILTIVLGAIFIRNTVFAAQNYYINTHANYEKVYATIVRYELTNGRYSYNKSYSTFYEYEADGMVYSGIWQRLIYDEEEAKAQVGKKVPIYIDHALKRHTDNLNFTSSPIWLAGTFSFVCFVVFLNSFISEIIFIVRWKKYKKESHLHHTI